MVMAVSQNIGSHFDLLSYGSLGRIKSIVDERLNVFDNDPRCSLYRYHGFSGLLGLGNSRKSGYLILNMNELNGLHLSSNVKSELKPTSASRHNRSRAIYALPLSSPIWVAIASGICTFMFS